MKLLIDMNLSPLWVDCFSASHIEAVHWSAIGAMDAPDNEIMDYALEFLTAKAKKSKKTPEYARVSVFPGKKRHGIRPEKGYSTK